MELTNLNSMINEIKILTGSINILDKAVEFKDEISRMTSLDAINFRVREISKTSIALALNEASKDSNNLSALQIEGILIELSNPTPNIKKLHELMDTQLEALRKMALSEILNLSVE